MNAERLLRKTFAAKEQDVSDSVTFTPVRRRRMTPFYAAVAAIVVLIGGVYGGLQFADDSGSPAGSPSPSTWFSYAPKPPPAPIDVTAQTGVIHELIDQKHWPTDRLYILDAPWSTAEDPMGPGKRGTRYSANERAAIAAGVEDLAPVQWIRDPESVKQGGQSCGEPRRNGTIITLGPLRKVKGHSEMGATSWRGCEAGFWTTYVLKQNSTGWQVTGTTGPQTIS